MAGEDSNKDNHQPSQDEQQVQQQQQQLDQQEASSSEQSQEQWVSQALVASSSSEPHRRLFHSDFFAANAMAQMQAFQQQQSANTLSSAAFTSPMNFLHPGSTMEEAYGTAAQRQQLLSALLSEGLGQHNLEAHQQCSHVDHTNALSTVNRALQQQLLMSELLRSPSSAAAQRNVLGLSPNAMFDRLPLPPYLGNHQPQQGPNSNQPQHQTPSLGAMLPPRSLDLVRTQPIAPLGLLGDARCSLGPSALSILVGGSKGLDFAPVDRLGKMKASPDDDDEDSKDKEKNEGRMLPPRKRRKTVIFEVDEQVADATASSIDQDEANAASIDQDEANAANTSYDVHSTFPLPALTEEGAKKARLDVPPKLVSFKNTWKNLDKATKNKRSMMEEFFRRRLQTGRVSLSKRRT